MIKMSISLFHVDNTLILPMKPIEDDNINTLTKLKVKG